MSQLHVNSQAAFRFSSPHFTGVSLEILALLEVEPMTCEQVAKKMGKESHQISGRFKPMKEAGLIEAIGTRKTKTGCMADIWKRTKA